VQLLPANRRSHSLAARMSHFVHGVLKCKQLFLRLLICVTVPTAQVTEETMELLASSECMRDFSITERGSGGVLVKGKGRLKTFWVASAGTSFAEPGGSSADLVLRHPLAPGSPILRSAPSATSPLQVRCLNVTDRDAAQDESTTSHSARHGQWPGQGLPVHGPGRENLKGMSSPRRSVSCAVDCDRSPLESSTSLHLDVPRIAARSRSSGRGVEDRASGLRARRLSRGVSHGHGHGAQEEEQYPPLTLAATLAGTADVVSERPIVTRAVTVVKPQTSSWPVGPEEGAVTVPVPMPTPMPHSSSAGEPEPGVSLPVPVPGRAAWLQWAGTSR
jgi:hypothetical protein